MATKKVQATEEVKNDVSCEKCAHVNCGGANCGYCPNGVCGARPCRGWGWRIASIIFRTILMLVILAIVFAIGAAVGGAGMIGYVNNGDFAFGPGMMNGGGMMGNWAYRTEKLFDGRSAVGNMMYNNLKEVRQNSLVRVFGNITEIGNGEFAILDNSGKEVKVVSGSFTIIETSKGEIGLKDLKVDEGVTVYGVLVDGGAIKASNIKVSR
jgi:hypothetical protein